MQARDRKMDTEESTHRHTGCRLGDPLDAITCISRSEASFCFAPLSVSVLADQSVERRRRKKSLRNAHGHVHKIGWSWCAPRGATHGGEIGGCQSDSIVLYTT